MTLPARYDMPVWSGNTFSRAFAFKDSNDDPVDLTGSKLVFRAAWNGGSIRKDTDDATGFDITDEAGGEAELTLSVSDTRSLPSGNIRYELERWIGAVQTSLLYGELNVTLWVNDDVDP